MQYDPVKKVFGNIVSRNVFFRKIFYFLLDLIFLRAWHIKKILKTLYKREEKLSIFDAGMGFGQYTYFLAKRFPQSDILAIDVKEEQVDDCKYFFGKTGYDNVHFQVEDLTKLEYESKFDFILNVDVMEHIDEDELVLRNFSKALKKGGKLMINTPSNLGGSDAHSDEDDSFIEEHARNGYGKDELIGKVEKAGMKVNLFKYTYGKFGKIYWRFGIKYPILIAGASKILILILPLYYLFTLWFVLIFMWLDVRADNKEGTGIILIAEKE
ncbi:MAG TPA: class I SAM-dependent methyltransferase [Ignavibacteria bacterium]